MLLLIWDLKVIASLGQTRDNFPTLEEQLDRVLANVPWMRNWHKSTDLTRYMSDHNSIVLQFCKHGSWNNSNRRKEKGYKFEKNLIE